MSTLQLLDAAGRRRSRATLPGFHARRPPRNKGFRYPPDPPRVEEIVAVMRQAGETDHGLRVRALIVVLWRAGLRIGKAMALTEPGACVRRVLQLAHGSSVGVSAHGDRLSSLSGVRSALAHAPPSTPERGVRP